jgi:hypothetical protein
MYPVTFELWVTSAYHQKLSKFLSPASTYRYILSQINFIMYILGTYKYENPVLVHTAYILFSIFRTDIYQHILGMYWYEHFRGVSSRVSGFQMPTYTKQGSSGYIMIPVLVYTVSKTSANRVTILLLLYLLFFVK